MFLSFQRFPAPSSLQSYFQMSVSPQELLFGGGDLQWKGGREHPFVCLTVDVKGFKVDMWAASGFNFIADCFVVGLLRRLRFRG